jgi:putative hemolysin
MEFIVLLLLILLNGLFALSELAIVSASRAKLQQQAENGNKSAAIAIQLADDPNRFLSTVQIGITLIGIIAGAFGGSAITDDIAGFVSSNLPLLAPYAHQIGFAVIVSITTYLSLVIGELVPKRIALNNPERMAILMARPMLLLSRITAPIVWFLSKSTEFVSRLLGFHGDENQFITDFDVFALMREGLTSGEFDAEEHAMVQGALELDDIQVREIFTPRPQVVTLDVNDTQEALRATLAQHQYSVFPVTDGDIDNIIGMVSTKDLLAELINDSHISIKAILCEAVFVPETVAAAEVLRLFKQSPLNMAVIIDEHGGTEGIITLSDIVEQVLGNTDMAAPEITTRPDGSWLIDGDIAMDELTELIPDLTIPEDEKGDYTTLAGFVLKRVERVPDVAATFVWGDYTFEVVDMDGKRIDKVLVSRQPEPS